MTTVLLLLWLAVMGLIGCGLTDLWYGRTKGAKQ